MNHQPSTMSALSSDSSAHHLSPASPNTVHSRQSRDYSTMEFYLASQDPRADHGPELSPAERVRDLSQLQTPESKGEKTGLGINSMFGKNGSNDERLKRKRKYWLIGAVVVTVIVIVLAVALPVGLTRRGKKSR